MAHQSTAEEQRVPDWVKHAIWWQVYPLGFTSAEATGEPEAGAGPGSAREAGSCHRGVPPGLVNTRKSLWMRT